MQDTDPAAGSFDTQAPPPVERRFAVHGPRRSWSSYVLIAINVLVFVLMAANGVSLMSPTPEQIWDWGANHGPAVAAGQWWRLLSSAFVHIGLIHIAFNMYAFRSLGPVVERLYGNGALILIYLLSALGASVASILWNPRVLSAGASGAVFGVAGALLAFFLMHRHAMPQTVFRQLMKNMGTFIVVNVAFGLMVPGIDNAAHMGGLATGFVSGWCLDRDITQAPALTLKRLVRSALFACVLVAGASLIPGRVAAALEADGHDAQPHTRSSGR